MAAEQNIFLDAVVLLGGAVIAAPLFKRIGLGTVLGYLAAGIVLGPVLQYIRDGEQVLHFAEIGIVFLLFIIGLELKPGRLWEMRSDIFGLGAGQVCITGVVISVIAWLSGAVSLQAAVIVGFGLALSSTAFALQVMEDQGTNRTSFGKRAFGILLFQDIAIVPLLVAVPLLAAGSLDLGAEGLTSAAIAFACLAGLLLTGRYLLNPLFGVIAATGAREAMIAAALLIVLGAAVLMQYAGLSMAMGAFIAGVMLAESSYRHELEADIEPFRGIFLGLFFVAVGLSVDLEVVWDNLLLIALLVPATMAIKATIIYMLCRLFGSPNNDAIRVACILPQHGEFGFVLFSAAVASGLLDSQTSSFLIAAVTLSMALTPLSAMLGERLIPELAHEEMDEDFEDAGSDVLMIGFSRLGQIAAQTLLAGGVDVTVLDNGAERIRQANRFGFRIYFGDGTRKHVLLAAGIERAKIVAVCTQKIETTNHIVDLIRSEFPEAKVFVRSYDRNHALDLRKREVDYEIRETFESALLFGSKMLQGIHCSEAEATAIVEDVRKRDLERMEMQVREGIFAGMDKLHNEPQTPEPLIAPVREGRAVDESSRAVLEESQEKEPQDS